MTKINCHSKGSDYYFPFLINMHLEVWSVDWLGQDLIKNVLAKGCNITQCEKKWIDFLNPLYLIALYSHPFLESYSCRKSGWGFAEYKQSKVSRAWFDSSWVPSFWSPVIPQIWLLVCKLRRSPPCCDYGPAQEGSIQYAKCVPFSIHVFQKWDCLLQSPLIVCVLIFSVWPPRTTTWIWWPGGRWWLLAFCWPRNSLSRLCEE